MIAELLLGHAQHPPALADPLPDMHVYRMPHLLFFPVPKLTCPVTGPLDRQAEPNPETEDSETKSSLITRIFSAKLADVAWMQRISAIPAAERAIQKIVESKKIMENPSSFH
jgi:hypothetical protein